MVGASGGGLAYSFVSQGLKVKPALSLAACYAVAGGTLHKVIVHEPIQKNIYIYLSSSYLPRFLFSFQVKETISARSELSTRGKASDT